MNNRTILTLVFAIGLVLLSSTAVSAQQHVVGGSVGVRAGEIAQAVMVVLTSLLMTWMSRG